MSNITEIIKEALIKRCEAYEKKTDYNYWENHIKYVVKNAKELAREYNADIEIVELGALLHDIAVPSEYGDEEEHHIIEEQCVADADVMAHFDCIPDLFSLVYHDKNMNIY